MVVAEFLGNIYSTIEEKFYGLMDALEERGIPVYSVIEPIEERGIPFLPVFIAILIILLIFLAMIFFTKLETSIIFEIKDQKGNTVNSVNLSVVTEKDDLLFTRQINSGETIKIDGVPIGATLYGRASKIGYKTTDVRIPIKSKENNIVRILLEKEENKGKIIINLKDNETETNVRNAKVTIVRSDGIEINCILTAQGNFECNDIIDGENAIIKVESSNYESETISKKLNNGSSIEIKLIPKMASLAGDSLVVIKVFDYETKEIVKDANISIYKGNETEPITNIISQTGEYIEKIPKGNIIRVVVTKEGYVVYDSQFVEGLRTLRQDEEKFEVYLKKGADEVLIVVKDQSGSPIPKSKVSVYNSSALLISSKETDLVGGTYFKDINGNEKYYVTVYKEGFLPKRQVLEPPIKNIYIIEIIPKTTVNSATIQVAVVQSDRRPANNATINFYEILNNTKYPLGIPQQQTDLEGKYVGYVPLDINLLVEASKGYEFGISEKNIEYGRNEIVVYMTTKSGFIKLLLFDEYGNELKEGHVKITNGSGELLYEEDLNNTNEIWVDKGNSNNIIIEYKSKDGKIYSEEINVEGKTTVELKVSPKEPESLTPKIEFLGIFTTSDKEVSAVGQGKEYYAKFKIELPRGNYKSGLHVRVGSDEIKNADALDIGILGYNAPNVKSFIYGKTYNNSPLPGFEGIDRQNLGKAGQYNKWLELKFEDSGTKIVKVRIKVKDTVREEEFELKYRAWLEAAGKVYRTPNDPDLRNEPYTKEKMGLYAETENVKIKILPPHYSCESIICAAYRFIDENGNKFNIDNFKPVLGKKYALEVEMFVSKDISANVKVSTEARNPRIYLIDYGFNYPNFPIEEKTNTNLEIKDISLRYDEKQKMNIYFNTIEEGPSNINLQIVSPADVVRESFIFNIYRERDLAIKFEPEELLFGEDFVIIVKDDENKGIENATVRIINKKGEIVKSIIGSSENGKNGIYQIKNNLDSGKYKVQISAEGFKPFENEISIKKTGILSVDKEIKISIPKGNEYAQTKIKIENKGSERVENITYEIIKDSDFPQQMDIIVTMPASLEKYSSQYGNITVEYKGPSERAHGEATLKITGKIFGEYDVIAESRIKVDYNPKYQGCLQTSNQRLVAYLGTNVGSAVDINFKVKNNCEGRLIIDPEIVARNEDDHDQGIVFSANSIDLMPLGGENSEKIITIKITNNEQRNLPEKKVLEYEVRLKSDSITESIPLEVVIWNPANSLIINRNIDVWLATTEAPIQTNSPIAIIPLFAKNAGEADIKELTFSKSAAKTSGYVNVNITPTNVISLLKKGDYLRNTFIEVKVGYIDKSVLSEVIEINITGIVNGQRYDFGPMIINAHVSPADCLKVSPKRISLKSTDTMGIITRTITITNGCSEEVLIRAIEPNTFGLNLLNYYPQGIILAPTKTAQIQISLLKREQWQVDAPLFVKGILQRSQKWVASEPIEASIAIGTIVNKIEASNQIEIPICDDNKKIKQINIPKYAISSECESAYCDAEQLAEFIGSKIKTKIDEVDNLILKNAENIQNTQCDPIRFRDYCPFELLGTTDEEYDVYFMNDSLTTEMLKDVIEKKIPSIKYFWITYAPTNAQPGPLISALGNRIYLEKIEGCGKYRIKVSGAVRISGSRIMKDYKAIVVSVNKEYEEEKTTELCIPKITNFVNFLPIDKSYGPNNNLGSWLSITNSENEETDRAAESLAQNLFGNKNRFVKFSTGANNKIVVKLGTQEGYLVKLSMSGSVRPTTIYAEILQGSEKEIRNIEEEAVKAIAAFRNGSIDGCISETEDYIMLKSAKGLGKLTIETPLKIRVAYKQKTCIDVNIRGELKEAVDLKAEIVGERNGIDEPWFEQQENKISEVSLIKDENSKTYVANVKLCIFGLEDFHNSHNKEIRINATAKTSKTRAEPRTIRIEVCGIHPYELIEKISDKNEGIYYATLTWKDANEYITISDMKKMANAKDQINNAEALLSGEEIPKEKIDTKNYENRVRQIGASCYGIACFATSLALGLTKIFAGPASWFLSIVGAVLDCGPGVLAAINPETGKYAKELIKKVFSLIGIEREEIPGVESVSEFIASGAAKEEINNMLTSAILGVSTKSLFVTSLSKAYNLQPGIQLTDSQANSIAKDIVRRIRDSLRSNNINIESWPELEESLAMQLKGKSVDELDKTLRESLETSIKEAVEKSIKKKEFAENMLKLLAKEEIRKSGAIKAAIKNTAKKSIEDIKLGESLNELLNQEFGIVSEEKTMSLITKKDQEKQILDTLKSRIKETVKNSLRDKFDDKAGEYLFNQINAEIESKLDSIIISRVPEGDGYKIKIDKTLGNSIESTIKNKVEKIALEAQEGVDLEIANAIRKESLKKVVPELVSKNSEDIIKTATKGSTRWNNIKNILKRSGSFGKGILSGVVQGTIANAAGLAAYKLGSYIAAKYYGIYPSDKVNFTGTIAELRDSDLDLEPDILINISSNEQKLFKGYPYKIVIKKDGLKRNVEFVNIPNNKLPKVPDESILDSCNPDNFDETVDMSLPTIIPNALDGPAEIDEKLHAKIVKRYLEKREGKARIGAIVTDISRKYNVSEELLITIAIWKTNLGLDIDHHITGCDYLNPETATDEASFECAAKQLNLIVNKTCTQEDEKQRVICILKEYNNVPNAKTGIVNNEDKTEYEKLYKIYEKWKEYRVY